MSDNENRVTVKDRTTKTKSRYYGLSESEVKYLNDFEAATQRYEGRMTFKEAQKKNPTLFHSKEAYNSLYNYRGELDRQRNGNDIMTQGTKVFVDPTDSGFGPEFVEQLRSQAEYCGRCLKEPLDCHCETAKRKSAYSEDDWRQNVTSSPEEAYTDMLDTHVKAFDLLPTGNAPDDLKNGTMVTIAIPKHSLRNKMAQIISKREQDGKYEIIVHDYKGGVRGFFSPRELKIAN